MRAIIAITALGIIAWAAQPAYPCINAVQLEGNKAVKRVVKGEKLVRTHRYARAARLLERHKVRFASDKLQKRANLVWCTASARRKRPNTWAIKSCAKELVVDKKWKKRPSTVALVAELYAYAGKKLQARELLEGLAARDIMPSAFGYRVLAQVHSSKELRIKALSHCRKMAKSKKVCSLKWGPQVR